MRDNKNINRDDLLLEDKFNLLKDGYDYEEYSSNYIKDKNIKKCTCKANCSNCSKRK